MSNTFLTPEDIAATAATLVGKELGIAGLVSRDLEAEFRSGKGSSARVRIPGAVVAQVRDIRDTSSALIVDEITEQYIDVTLTDHVYDLVPLSEGALDLDLVDFGAQVLAPQAIAIAKHVERAVTAALQATPENTTIAYAAATPQRAFTAIRKQLRDNGVPAEARLVSAVGSGVYADLLDAEALDDNGKVRGFEIFESTRLASDELVAFIPSAFTLVVRAPAVPDGAPYGASIKSNGFALRHIRSYDASVAADRSLLSCFLGVQAMPLPVDTETGTVSLVAHGGAVRMLTAA